MIAAGGILRVRQRRSTSYSVTSDPSHPPRVEAISLARVTVEKKRSWRSDGGAAVAEMTVATEASSSSNGDGERKRAEEKDEGKGA